LISLTQRKDDEVVSQNTIRCLIDILTMAAPFGRGLCDFRWTRRPDRERQTASFIRDRRLHLQYVYSHSILKIRSRYGYLEAVSNHIIWKCIL
jgi:hypothetical protein